MRHQRIIMAAVMPIGVAAPLVAGTSASAARNIHVSPAAGGSAAPHSSNDKDGRFPTLPAPPRPPAGAPRQRTGYKAPPARPHRRGTGVVASAVSKKTSGAHLTAASQAAVTPPAQAKTWGATGS